MRSSHSNPLPSREQELELYGRLVDGDPTAPADLAATYFNSLVEWVVEHNSRRTDEHLCFEAAGQALGTLVKNPSSYDSSRSGLFAYLKMSAQGDLRNLLRQEGRHQKGRKSIESVELSAQAGKYLGREDDASHSVEIQEESDAVRAKLLPAVCEGLNDGELRILKLILEGERKTEIFAEALGIGHLPTKLQRTEIKRVKDKLKKRIERNT